MVNDMYAESSNDTTFSLPISLKRIGSLPKNKIKIIKLQPAHLEAFDEVLVKRRLERIIVWKDHFTVELKSELKIDIDE